MQCVFKDLDFMEKAWEPMQMRLFNLCSCPSHRQVTLDFYLVPLLLFQLLRFFSPILLLHKILNDL